MKRIVMMAGCIVASCAFGGLVATASAEIPEFGHCVQVAPKTGNYSGNKCLVPKPGKGKYNWVPGPGAKPKFTMAVEEPVLKTTGGLEIKCIFGEGEGEYTNGKTATLKSIIFSSCQQSGVEPLLKSWCQNIGSLRGEITTKELTAELGFIEQSPKRRVGLDLKAKSGTALAMFECGGASPPSPLGEIGTGTGTLLELEGSVIGRVKKINKALEENLVTFTVSGGAQVPEQFEGGVKDTLTTLVGLSKTAEPSTFSSVTEILNEEPIEIKAK